MPAAKRKPLVERPWVQALGAFALMAFLLAAWITENYNYRLLWIAMPAGLAIGLAIVVRAQELQGAGAATRVIAALMLMPFLSWPIWVVANLANKAALGGPLQRFATVTGQERSYLHSGRSTPRYVMEVRLEGSGEALSFVVERKAGAYGMRVPVCEWTGGLGFTAFTLGRCRGDRGRDSSDDDRDRPRRS